MVDKHDWLSLSAKKNFRRRRGSQTDMLDNTPKLSLQNKHLAKSTTALNMPQPDSHHGHSGFAMRGTGDLCVLTFRTRMVSPGCMRYGWYHFHVGSDWCCSYILGWLTLILCSLHKGVGVHYICVVHIYINLQSGGVLIWWME